MDKEKLIGFCSDNSGLEKIGSIAEEKTGTWGYRTAVITKDGVEKTEGDAYTLLETSMALDTGDMSGKLALIVGIEGNIGSKGYFDNIKIEYSREVLSPIPVIEGIKGEGIKDNSVIIDKGERSVTVPVVPGTDMTKLELDISVGAGAGASFTSGTWENGIITVEYGDEKAEWSVSCVERGNPVLNGFYADPNIVCFDGTYYIYPTTDGGTGWNSTQFKVFSSKDLVNWTDEGVILDAKDIPWSGGVNTWAPTIAEKDGKYYFYFSAKNKNDDIKSLGVAVADSPTGPFESTDAPIVEGGELPGQMIDPAVFVDDDGSTYLYWGNGAMYMAKLSDDMLSIEGEIQTITPSNFREAAFVIKRNGVYYFMWSANDTGEPRYEVHYGTSDSPYGPIEGDTTILSYRNANDPRIKATGHNSVVNVPGTDEWYICYHRFNLPRYGEVTAQSSEAGNHREVCIDRMEFAEDGSIMPIIPTLEGITEPVEPKTVSFSKCAVNDGNLEFSLNIDPAADADIYTAVYGNDGSLIRLFKNEAEGSMPVDENMVYTVKVMAWTKDGMEPVDDAETRTVSSAGKIAISEDMLSGSRSWEDRGSVNFYKAADGDIETYFVGLAKGYVTINLGEPMFIHGIGYAPRTGYESRMNGGEFYGSNDNETWTLLYKVSSIPGSGSITKVGIDDILDSENAYRYVKYTVPAGTNQAGEEYLCNVAEIELYGISAGAAGDR